MLQHDQSGFLVGQLLDLNKDIASGQAQALSVLKGISTNVKSIARAVGVKPGSTPRVSRHCRFRARSRHIRGAQLPCFTSSLKSCFCHG
jgi:hypothetical protein